MSTRARSARSIVGGVIAGMAASVVGIAGSAPDVARAAVEFDWYRAANGFVRTNLRVTAMDVDPTTGFVYAVVRDDGGTSLVVIDPVTVEPIRQTVIATNEAATTNDVDVSADGATVAVTTRNSLVTMRASDLGNRATRSLGNSTGWNVRASGGASDPIVVWDLTGALLFREGVQSVLPEVPFDGGGDPQVAFDDVDPAIVWAQGNTGLVQYDVSTIPAVTATYPLTVRSNYLVPRGTQLWVSGAVLDKSLSGAGLEGLRWSWYSEASTHVITWDEPVLSLYDPDAWAEPPALTPERTLSWPAAYSSSIGDAIGLADGLVAVLEKGDVSEPTPWYLSFADANLLSSAFGQFHAITPFRMLDTRDGTGTNGLASPLSGGRPVTVDVTGRGSVPASEVIAVAANVTITEPTAATYLTLWPSETARPTVSNVNAFPGSTISNFATVMLSADGALDLVNAHGRAHVIVDVVGYYVGVGGARGSVFEGVDPTSRLVDTRRPFGGTRLGPGEAMTIDASDVAQHTAAVVNVTALGATAPTYVTVWPSDRPRPVASNVNLGPGDVRPNLVVTGLSSSGAFQIYNAHGSVDILVDLVGYYSAAAPVFGGEGQQAGRFFPAPPARRFDSRESSPFPAPGHLPSDSAVIFGGCCMWTSLVNVTAVTPSEDGYLSVLPWEDGMDLPDPAPLTSTVNFHAGDVVANGAYAFESQNFIVYNRHGNTHVVVDVFGYLQGGVPNVATVWQS